MAHFQTSLFVRLPCLHLSLQRHNYRYGMAWNMLEREAFLKKRTVDTDMPLCHYWRELCRYSLVLSTFCWGSPINFDLQTFAATRISHHIPSLFDITIPHKLFTAEKQRWTSCPDTKNKGKQFELPVLARLFCQLPKHLLRPYLASCSSSQIILVAKRHHRHYLKLGQEPAATRGIMSIRFQRWEYRKRIQKQSNRRVHPMSISAP